ncbi:hypothetical protein ASPFODRAFT_502603 [Aspergillus luchuensis CBS 106.47]|uniref:Uncharacterized protein n=1 Tax=Aspergillus luchuensis (strain CBS 106.47) TaxID=1137211 RepID=A0A1M3TT00_ASPLC|nr:hypothetical protein ASPFODRAFT_502603 [Aspergillus luchuensis CBS 106.47]
MRSQLHKPMPPLDAIIALGGLSNPGDLICPTECVTHHGPANFGHRMNGTTMCTSRARPRLRNITVSLALICTWSVFRWYLGLSTLNFLLRGYPDGILSILCWASSSGEFEKGPVSRHSETAMSFAQRRLTDRGLGSRTCRLRRQSVASFST